MFFIFPDNFRIGFSTSKNKKPKPYRYLGDYCPGSMGPFGEKNTNSSCHIPLDVSTTFSSSIHQLVNSGCFNVLIIVNNAAVKIGVQISFWGGDFSSLDKYPEVGLLDPMAVLFFIFWGLSILFSRVATPIYIPNNALGFLCLHNLANTCYFLPSW